MHYSVRKTALQVLVWGLLLLGCSQNASAQRQIGGGIVFGTGTDDIGLGLRARLPISGDIYLAPGIDFMEYGSNRYFIALNADIQAVFNVSSSFYLYPLAGLTLGIRDRYYTSRWGDDEIELGINLGGGGLYYFNSNLAGLLELRAVVGGFEQLVLTMGLMVDI